MYFGKVSFIPRYKECYKAYNVYFYYEILIILGYMELLVVSVFSGKYLLFYVLFYNNS